MQDVNIEIEQVLIDNERFYKISNVDHMRPFFMSIVSDSNHWMFIGSNGGLSAGRKDAENSLFPYYTDDKIIESVDNTGSKSIFHIQQNGKSQIWEPFSIRYECLYHTTRNLYKNVYGNKILFEEVNHDLNLTFQYQWNSSNRYGFVKTSMLINDSNEAIDMKILDGIQNIMPFGVGSALQKQSSNLVDAYKRNELLKGCGIGVFALSAIIVDKAEPSEALKANIAWSTGLDNPDHLLSSLQLNNFRKGLSIIEETDIKAERGAYFVSSEIKLPPNSNKKWSIIANVNQTMDSVISLSESIKNDQELNSKIKLDVTSGTKNLIELNAAADGIQLTQDQFRDTRHFSNALFNIMRGGIFDNNYQIEKDDISNYLSKANDTVYSSCKNTIHGLSDQFPLSVLKELINTSNDSHFKRLCLEYLPLKFSRRHGDPSRPWNQFSINTHNENDGSKILDYQGNWRDIFQNWEALAYSYPEFIEGMIFKFLNASTFDGYNPYRVTKHGIDWERIEPDDPWSYIGYWGDHQTIYLLKLLEFSEKHTPGKLQSYFEDEIFVYANVPYKIKSYQDILKNPKDTIEFDLEADLNIEKRTSTIGADGVLLQDISNKIHQINFIEKVLATVLAKVSNFIPGGGIWMNTQRPEWNDANNALVGNGVSMVTLYYLRRFLVFLNKLLSTAEMKEVTVSEELQVFYKAIFNTLQQNKNLLSNEVNDLERKCILDGLGTAGSDFRLLIYDQSFTGKRSSILLDELKEFTSLCLEYLEHTIDLNKRDDSLYHAYNLMTVESQESVSIDYLSEMLEGQVAILSSGYLSSKEAVEVLDSLKGSSLFREDQYSYILYPNKVLPGFTEKNNISTEAVKNSVLLTELIKKENTEIITQDVLGRYHFNGNFKNANDLRTALGNLEDSPYNILLEKDRDLVLQIFEDVFNHKAFTGRSGTFFGYEGLGSIYWHMVSKLQLAVQECCIKAVEEKESDEIIGRLLEHYYEINEGIGVHKSPTLYGAFPTDPYSHTPAGKGAQQPGMTGQVKEDVLCRFGELGVVVNRGKLSFQPYMLRKDEFLSEPQIFKYVDVNSESKEIRLQRGTLSFTYCQIPIMYKLASEDKLEVVLKNETHLEFKSLSLPEPTSRMVFTRSGDIVQIIVYMKEANLR